MAAEQGRRSAVIKVAGGLAALVLMVGFVELVRHMMALKVNKPDRAVQSIQLIRPPPPPPPPPEQPPPPPPPEKVQEQLPQDKPDPAPEQEEQQAPDVLANDGPASAGSDAFGMHQGSGGTIGGTGTAPFAWYTDRMRDAIKDKLTNSACVKSAKGSITTRMVVGADGRVKKVELVTSTGNPGLDACLDKAFASITRLGAEPPPGMPEAVNLRVVF